MFQIFESVLFQGPEFIAQEIKYLLNFLVFFKHFSFIDYLSYMKCSSDST